eukprot:scaffold2401_cov111-Cylindrotheca_fusiformis.AAC.10
MFAFGSSQNSELRTTMRDGAQDDMGVDSRDNGGQIRWLVWFDAPIEWIVSRPKNNVHGADVENQHHAIKYSSDGLTNG